MIITTMKEYLQACKDYGAAQYFYTASCDPDEIKRAGDKVTELEQAFEDCPFNTDEKGIVHLVI